MRLFLASGERFFREFKEVGVQFVLISFFHLRQSRNLIEMLDYLDELAVMSSQMHPSSVFVDSGIYSLKVGTSVLTDSALETYAELYCEFLQREDTRNLNMIAELDYYEDVTDRNGKVIEAAGVRVRRWRERLYDIVGDRLVPVLVPEMTWEEKEKLCSDVRFKWVAMASNHDPDVPEHERIYDTCRHINLAHKYGKKIHLFGQTGTQTTLKYLRHADSCDSSTWVGSTRFGTTYICQNGRMDNVDHSYKYKKKFYVAYFRKIGCDPKKILGTHREHAKFCDGPDSVTTGCIACTEQSREMKKASLIAWRNYASHLGKVSFKKDNVKTPSKEIMENKVNNSRVTALDNIPRRKSWVGKGVKPLYAEFGGYKCPTYRTMPKDVENKLVCSTCDNQKICIYVERMEAENRERILNPPPEPITVEKENPTPELTRKKKLKVKVKRDYGAGKTTEKLEPEALPSSTLKGYGKAIEAWLKTDEVNATHGPPKGEIRPAVSVPVALPEKTEIHLPVIQQDGAALAARARGNLAKDTPAFICDTCAISDNCPKFKPGEICFYMAPLSEFDTRNPESLLALMQFFTEKDAERTFMAMVQERVQTGGMIDKRVSDQIDRYFKRAKDMLELSRNIDGAESAQNSGPNIHNNIMIGGTGGGIISQLFSGKARESDAAEKPVIDTTTG